MKKLFDIPKKNKALVLYDINKLVYDEVENYELKDDCVLVKIKCCGICSSDIERIFVDGTYHFPTIPGHEMSGQIVCVNDGDEELLGKRVAIFPLIPCMECSSCEIGEYAQCSNYNYFGSRCDGGFSEYLLVPKWNLVFLDDSVDYNIACLCEPTAVSLHALKIGKVQKGDSVAINGTGTIAVLIGFLARSRGANVTFVGRNARKLAIIKNYDFDILNVSEISDNNKFNKVFEVVGTNQSINQSINLADSFATIVMVGNPKEDVVIEKKTYWKILRKQLVVVGSWNSSYNTNVNDWNEVIEIMKNKSIPFSQLITKEFFMKDADEAFRFVMDKGTDKFKVVFRNE